MEGRACKWPQIKHQILLCWYFIWGIGILRRFEEGHFFSYLTSNKRCSIGAIFSSLKATTLAFEKTNNFLAHLSYFYDFISFSKEVVALINFNLPSTFQDASSLNGHQFLRPVWIFHPKSKTDVAGGQRYQFLGRCRDPWFPKMHLLGMDTNFSNMFGFSVQKVKHIFGWRRRWTMKLILRWCWSIFHPSKRSLMWNKMFNRKYTLSIN